MGLSMKREVTQTLVHELLSYEPETGSFTWNIQRRGKKPADGFAGSVNKISGYRVINIDRTEYKAHRLAWLYMTGKWPVEFIDHKNGDRSDNRWCNLREATHSQNMRNRGVLPTNTSGLKGVVWHKRQKKWCAQSKLNGKNIYLGSFDCPAAAHFAYVVWADIHHGEFAKVA